MFLSRSSSRSSRPVSRDSATITTSSSYGDVVTTRSAMSATVAALAAPASPTSTDSFDFCVKEKKQPKLVGRHSDDWLFAGWREFVRKDWSKLF